VSPRRNRPRRGGPSEQPRPDGDQTGPERREDGWVVRPVGGGSAKTYRCPGCDQEIRPGVPHVVAWLEDALPTGAGGADNRRHWHTPCWRARERRGPRQR
jgi:hypothetical protein